MDVPLGMYPWEQNLQTQTTVDVRYSVKNTENVKTVLSKQRVTTIYIVFLLHWEEDIIWWLYKAYRWVRVGFMQIYQLT